jgi:predicted signal transduction protein with EAL and GGDEF domain
VTTVTATLDAKERRTMAGVLLVAALLVVAYWTAWLVHRSLVASETGAAYTQFEDAFPLADGWLAICLVAASYCLVTMRRAALFWLLAGGGAGVYLFGMDVLYDLQHGVWGKGANGLVELAINVLTIALSAVVLRWTWVRRDALLKGT